MIRGAGLWRKAKSAWKATRPAGLQACSHVLTCLGIAAACLLSLTGERGVPITIPVVLVAASAVMWLRTKNRNAALLQMTVGAYLCSVPVNEIIAQYLKVPFWGLDLQISHSLLVLALLAAGVAARTILRGKRTNGARRYERTLWVWGLVFAVLVVHVAVQAAILHACYGCGYERSIVVLGWISLFCLVYIAASETLQVTLWRRGICVILVAYYAAVSAGVG